MELAISLQTDPKAPSRDWEVAQDWTGYSPEDHAVWDTLFERQAKTLLGRATPAFHAGLHVLRMDGPGVPNLDALSDRLMSLTGWKVVAVPGLIPDADFFRYLANRTMVVGRFMRTREQGDYLQEPDIFHDLFGHVPLLAHPVFADYMQAYGEGGLRSLGLGSLHRLARLYWYTVEFGLIRDGGELGLYGAGIASSFTESVAALTDPSANRIGFDLQRVMRTQYRIDGLQRTYFVIDSFEDLLRQTLETDFAPLYEDLADAPDLSPDDVLPTDVRFAPRPRGFQPARPGALP